MIVRVTDNIKFPNTGWLSSEVVGPHNGRYLVEIRGHSGMSSWVCGLMTFPQDALTITQEYEWTEQKISLVPINYEIVEAQDRRGQRLLRFYSTLSKPDYILFSAYGYLVPEASSKGVQVLLETEGYSRTGKNGDRWGLFVAPAGAIVAVDPYDSEEDPIYYQVTKTEVRELGSTDAVLSPEDW